MESKKVKSDKPKQAFLPFNKKGQIQSSVGGVIFLIVGLGVATLIQIFVGVLGGKTYQLVEDDIDAITGLQNVTNETFTLTNNSAHQLNHVDINTGSLKIFYAIKPGQPQIATGNFSVINLPDGQITVVINDNVTNPLATNLTGVNYTYGSNTIRGNIKSGIASSFEANKQTGELMPVVALAFMVILVLGLLLSLFSGSGMGGSSGGNVL